MLHYIYLEVFFIYIANMLVTVPLITLIQEVSTMTEQKEHEQKWEELDDIYNVLAQSIVTISANLSETLSKIKGKGYDNDKELTTTVIALTTDINSFVEDLKTIHDQHEGRHGKIENSEDLALCIDLFNEYVILNDKFKAIVVMPMLTITEYMGKVIDTLKKEVNDEQ